MKSGALKDDQLRIRISSELKKAFAECHVAADRDQSDTLREMMKAAVRYYERHGNLYPPWDLVRQDTGGGTSTVVAPVINGHRNHVSNGDMVRLVADHRPTYQVGRSPGRGKRKGT